MASKPQGLPANFYSTAETRSKATPGSDIDEMSRSWNRVALTVLKSGSVSNLLHTIHTAELVSRYEIIVISMHGCERSRTLDTARN